MQRPRIVSAIRAILSAVTLITLITLIVLDSAAESVDWVLPPSATEALAQSWRDGPLVARDIAIDSDRALMTLCAEGSCFEARLSHPTDSCLGERLEAWCVEIDDGGRPYRSTLLIALRRHRIEDIWIAVRSGSQPREDLRPEPEGDFSARHLPADEVGLITQPEAPRPESEDDFVPSDLPAYGIGLLMLFGPFVIGLRIGRAVTAWEWTRSVSPLGRAILSLGPLGLVLLLPGSMLRVGAWDLALMALLLGFGLWLGAQRPGLRHCVALAGGLIAALLLFEFGARALLPVPPAFPPASQAHLRVPELWPVLGQKAAELLYATQLPARLQRGDRPVVMHLGDSMLFGRGFSNHDWVVERLARADPERQHVNLGSSGTGTDHQMLVLRRWLGELRPELVVLHLFENDAVDLEKYYSFCAGPLLDYREDPPRWRCPEPVPRSRFSRAVSPAPYPLRVATGFSFAARHLCWVSRPRSASVQPALEEGYRRHRVVLSMIAELTRKHDVEIMVVAMPSRRSIEHRGAEFRLKLLAGVEKVGMRILDSQPLFEQALAGRPAEALFDDRTDDPHLNAEGHALLAEWLAPRLRRREDAP